MTFSAQHGKVFLMTDIPTTTAGDATTLIPTIIDHFTESAEAFTQGKPQPATPSELYSDLGLGATVAVTCSLFASTLSFIETNTPELVTQMTKLREGVAHSSPTLGRLLDVYLVERSEYILRDGAFRHSVESVADIPFDDKADVLDSAIALGTTAYLTFVSAVDSAAKDSGEESTDAALDKTPGGSIDE